MDEVKGIRGRRTNSSEFDDGDVNGPRLFFGGLPLHEDGTLIGSTYELRRTSGLVTVGEETDAPRPEEASCRQRKDLSNEPFERRLVDPQRFHQRIQNPHGVILRVAYGLRRNR